MNFICPKCGKVEPKDIGYSFPATAKCPKCGMEITSNDKIVMLTEQDARKMRPSFYKECK